jgi:uncharacterized protein YfaQ (DUF2300 family)
MFRRRSRLMALAEAVATLAAQTHRATQNQETIMASVADLTTATSTLAAAVTDALAVLTAPPADGTHLSVEDQAALDASVAAINQAAANLNAALPATPSAADAASATTVDTTAA